MHKDDLKGLAQTVGKAIARHRKAKGLGQEQLAERLNIGNEAVSRMERGTVMPTIARLAELAEIFECPTADLLAEVSTSSRDKTSVVQDKLQRLSETDRLLVLEIVDKLAARLV
jgi:transcriptional regulator with XRE-family HTH domain